MMPAFTAAQKMLAERAEQEKRKVTPTQPTPTIGRDASPIKGYESFSLILVIF